METPDFLPADGLEWRRFRALYLRRQGWSRQDIAEALGVSRMTISRWLAHARDGGPDALRAHPSPGAPPKLSAAQKRLIRSSSGMGLRPMASVVRSGPVPASPK